MIGNTFILVVLRLLINVLRIEKFSAQFQRVMPPKGAYFPSLVFVLGKIEGINNSHLERLN